MNAEEKIAMYKAFPEKRIGGAVLLFDEDKKLMIVKPNYREHWLLPGGISEKDESPSETAVRETKEEIGLTVKIEKLLIVDYKKNKIGEDYIDEFISFLFLVEPITNEEKKYITLQGNELSEYRFTEISEACELLVPSVGQRIKNQILIVRLQFIWKTPLEFLINISN